MNTLSTHVLDTARGRPAAGITVTLTDVAGGLVAEGVTDADGRVKPLGPELPDGTYRIRFDLAGTLDGGAFFPEVVIAFTVSGGEHFHVPLLLSPFGYSTYRGS